METRPADPALKVSARPEALSYARVEATHAEWATASWHIYTQLTIEHRAVLALLDGTRDLDAIVAALSAGQVKLDAERVSRIVSELCLQGFLVA